MISISYLSTLSQFSSSQIAIEYGSSPVEHGTDQMRIGSPGRFFGAITSSSVDVRQRN